MSPHQLVNTPVLTRHKCAIMLVALVIPLLSTIITAQPLGSVLLRNSGAISYPLPRIIYIMTNATATYELSSTFQVITYSTNSLTVLNHAIQDVSLLEGSLFVYNGTYQVDGTINMQSNVNMTLQDGVFINETGNNQRITSWTDVSNSLIWAHSNATIHGMGSNGYDLENAFWLNNVNNITIGAAHPNGLVVYNIGAQWLHTNGNPVWINNSVFVNIRAYKWATMGLYNQHGMLLDGAQNVQIINITSDGSGSYARSPLVIGGEGNPSNNVTIIGGVYENSAHDNGIYIGGWQKPVTNLQIINVTTANNTKLGHSGIKLRPAMNVTVIGWVSNGDFNGMECGTAYDSEADIYPNQYNNVTGTVNSPLNCGLILTTDGSNKNQKTQFNVFNLAINNASKPGVWIDNENGGGTSVNNNTLFINATGGQRYAIDFAGSGNVSYNTVYGRFVQNGQGGFADLVFENLTSTNYNVVNVYSTSGNAHGLYSGDLGTNVVNYPYP